MILNLIVLQAANNQSGLFNLIFIALIFVVFWFFIIRPQAKKQKEQKTFMESLKKGDEVVSSSGILGKITKIEDEIVTLEVGTKVYIRMTRNAISKDLTESVYGANNKS